ncbi:MAG: aldo/keto reductase [Thermomicrobiales bacterium]|nr:aldo/keto reductase [Thermomicrobiales bacterium]
MGTVPTIQLHNGIAMPLLGFGVFQMTDEEAEQSVVDAIDIGYRLIDTATSYMNERAVGRGIARVGIAREDLFVTSKLWVADASYDGTITAYQRSLDKLGLEYLDLYLIHQPYGDIYGAWRALEDLYEEGKVKAIGVSNFSPARLTDLMLNNRIKPMVNQIETHPFHQQVAAHELMQAEGVVHEGWAPFAEGRSGLFSNETLVAIANKHGKSVGQVVLRWDLQREVVSIPKSVRRDRIAENFAIFDFELDDSDMQRIAELDEEKKLFVDHEDPAFVKMLFSRVLPD